MSSTDDISSEIYIIVNSISSWKLSYVPQREVFFFLGRVFRRPEAIEHYSCHWRRSMTLCASGKFLIGEREKHKGVDQSIERANAGTSLIFATVEYIVFVSNDPAKHHVCQVSAQSLPVMMPSSTTMNSFLSPLFDDNGDDHQLPPGLPPMRVYPLRYLCLGNELTSTTEKFEGPWFTTQLIISATIGIVSFLLFSYCRTRWPLSFAPRTKLKGT
jgi:hypothetical protein